DSSFPFDTPWSMPFSLFPIVLATFFIMGAALYDSTVIDRTAFFYRRNHLFLISAFIICDSTSFQHGLIHQVTWA
ncbi:hypothetical protein, partial [Escherichia coli]